MKRMLLTTGGKQIKAIVDTKCDALCLTHSKPKSVASIGFPGASLSGSVPVSLT